MPERSVLRATLPGAARVAGRGAVRVAGLGAMRVAGLGAIRKAGLGAVAAASLFAGCARSPAPAAVAPSAGTIAPAGKSNAAPAPSAAAAIPPGLWRATLALPGGELPFGLEFGSEGGRATAWLINGSERTAVDAVDVQGRNVKLQMPGFANFIEARLEDRSLRGTLVMIKSGGKQQRITFTAQQGASWRFFDPNAAVPAPRPAVPGLARPKPVADVDVAGRWAVTFVDGGKPSPAVGEFEQRDRAVTGTFLTPTGDHRFLAGEVRGNELWLSKFDGGHAFLYRARQLPDGRLEGRFWSGSAHQEHFSARRDAAANLGNSENVTRLKSARAGFDFTFPDLDGRPVSLHDARFAGKVVIVALAGSWCPNCHDEAAYLVPLYRARHDEGLEVISLMFEQFGDAPQARAATQRFRAHYGIEYPTLIAGISSADDAASKLPQLNGVFAFPTTVFVDRAGKVRRIHTGFSGPATGAHYTRMTGEFESLVAQMLAEPAPGAAADARGASAEAVAAHP